MVSDKYFKRTFKGRIVYSRKWHGFTWIDACRIIISVIQNQLPSYIDLLAPGRLQHTDDPFLGTAPAWMYIVFLWIESSSFLATLGTRSDVFFNDLRFALQKYQPQGKTASECYARVTDFLNEKLINDLIEIITGISDLLKE